MMQQLALMCAADVLVLVHWHSLQPVHRGRGYLNYSVPGPGPGLPRDARMWPNMGQLWDLISSCSWLQAETDVCAAHACPGTQIQGCVRVGSKTPWGDMVGMCCRASDQDQMIVMLVRLWGGLGLYAGESWRWQC